MGEIISLYRPHRSRKRVYFNRTDLSQLLNVYSRRVATGEWRDYAIDHGQGMAIFSIFRHASERPLFAVVKLDKGGRGGEWLLYNGPRKLAQAKTLPETLAFFDRKIRLISS